MEPNECLMKEEGIKDKVSHHFFFCPTTTSWGPVHESTYFAKQSLILSYLHDRESLKQLVKKDKVSLETSAGSLHVGRDKGKGLTRMSQGFGSVTYCEA